MVSLQLNGRRVTFNKGKYGDDNRTHAKLTSLTYVANIQVLLLLFLKNGGENI